MIAEKISRPLAESLARPDDGEWVDVIVEIAAPAGPDAAGSSRAEKIAARKATFARHAEPVSQTIRRMGGEVTEQAWINGSLRARIAKRVVPSLSDEEQVTRLDLPRTLHTDVK